MTPKWVEIQFSRSVIVNLATLLERMWRNREPPFDRFHEPENQYMPLMIRHDERLMRCWYHGFANVNRYGKKAHQLGRDLKELMVRKPYLFDPLDPRSQEYKRFKPLRDVIPFANMEKYECRVGWWFDGLAKIRDEYGGDPGNIILNAPFDPDSWQVNRNTIISRYSEFMGIKQKISQLAATFNLGTAWKDRADEWARWREIPFIATDIWLMRLAKQLGMVDSYNTDVGEYVRDFISDYLCQICIEEGLDSHAVVQALWHTGSTVCGRERPKTGNYRKYCREQCPVYEFCQGIVPSNNRFKAKGWTVNDRSLFWDKMVPHPPEE